jgi:predicted transposase YbfD/YdcC
VTVCALLCGVDDFVGIEAWANERIDWLRRFLRLKSGIPSHDTFGRLFGLLDRGAVEKGFRRWVGSVLPALAEGTVVAIDGKASRRSKMTGQQALHLVSAFATEAQLILGQEACAEKSNELTAIPVLLEALLLKGAIVTIDAMGTHGHIAQAIRDKEADYVLAVKDNQPKLAESITAFFAIGQTEAWKNTPHTYTESVQKDHGRLEVRRCWAFSQLECLAAPQQWPDLKMFGVIEAQRTINGKTSHERRLYIGSIAPDAGTLANVVRAHWGIENRVHWCLDVALNDDQMRARMKNAGANLAIVRRLVLNLFRLDKSRKGGLHTRRILAASSDSYREALLGLDSV